MRGLPRCSRRSMRSAFLLAPSKSAVLASLVIVSGAAIATIPHPGFRAAGADRPVYFGDARGSPLLDAHANHGRERRVASKMLLSIVPPSEVMG